MSGSHPRLHGAGVGDFRRLLVSAAAALAVHAGIFLALPFSQDLAARKAQEPAGPITVQLEDRGTPATAIEARVQPVPSVKMADETRTSAMGVPIDDFIIPSPKESQDSALATVSSGSAFREAGGKTGTTASIPDIAASQVPKPDLSIGARGVQAPGGPDTGQTQRRGEGVAVSDLARQPTSGSLDLGSLDRSLERTPTAGEGTGTSQADSGQPGSGDYRVLWDEPETSRGRDLISAPQPKIPQWVSSQGLTLTATVSFALTPDGVVSGVRVERSSGWSDVDSALIDAIRRWRFTASKSTQIIRGKIPCVIRPQ